MNIIKQMDENRERRKQGLPQVKRSFPAPKQEQEQQQQQPPQLSQKAESAGTAKGYAYFQSQIQNQLAYFQAERFGQIANEARKEKHVLYKFDDNPQPPKLGEKKNTRDKLMPIEVYYNEIPNDIHYELDRMRSQVQDLTYVKSLQTSSINQDGQFVPAVLTKNDPELTGISNKTFARLNEEIDRLNKDIAAKMALWMYGIDKDLIPKLETSSLSTALEAGLYREMYGIVQSSKNLAVS